MIQFLADNIDQLDLALDQLAVSDRNFDRFALMLVDNVVELTLHKYIQDKASENELWKRLGEVKNDSKIVDKALGQNFDSKVKGARKLGLIDQELCESLLNLHSYRNTAYHKGLRHEGILHSLTIFYFRSACNLLRRYEPQAWGWNSDDKISYRAKKYLGESGLGINEARFQEAYDRLECVADSFDCNLVADLSEDMKKTINETNEDIEFLEKNGPEETSRDQVVIDSQLGQFSFSEEAKSYALSHGYVPTSNKGDLVRWMSSNYDWPEKIDPIPKWNSRLESLVKENNEHKALKKYCDFLLQTESIRSQITESAIQLDGHIQMQIDIMRGK